MLIRVDNKSIIELAKNLINHKRSKHINIQFHFNQKKIKDGSMELEHVGSKKYIVDMFTKVLSPVMFHEYRKRTKMKEGKI